MPQPPSRADAEALVRSWGYAHVFTWTDRPNTHYPPHSHATATTHLILSGSLTMRYPGAGAEGSVGGKAEQEGREGTEGEQKGSEEGKETLGVGARWDVEAGRVHEVWVGAGGCGYVIGE